MCSNSVPSSWLAYSIPRRGRLFHSIQRRGVHTLPAKPSHGMQWPFTSHRVATVCLKIVHPFATPQRRARVALKHASRSEVAGKSRPCFSARYVVLCLSFHPISKSLLKHRKKNVGGNAWHPGPLVSSDLDHAEILG